MSIGKSAWKHCKELEEGNCRLNQEGAGTTVSLCRPLNMNEEVGKERCALWRALAKLLPLLPPPLPEAPCNALQEDWQLRAFAPLTAAHSGIDIVQPLSAQVGAWMLKKGPCPCSLTSLPAWHCCRTCSKYNIRCISACVPGKAVFHIQSLNMPC